MPPIALVSSPIKLLPKLEPLSEYAYPVFTFYSHPPPVLTLGLAALAEPYPLSRPSL